MIYALPEKPTAYDIVRRSAVAHPSLLADTLEAEAANLRRIASTLEPTRATTRSLTGDMVGMASRLECAAQWLRDGEAEELQPYCEPVHGYKPPHEALRRGLVAIAGRLTCVPTAVMEAALGEAR